MHFGSMFAMSDYKSNAHNLYFSSSYNYSEKLTVFGTFALSKTKAELDQVIMPNVYGTTDGYLEHLYEVHGADTTSANIFGEMHEYSNLDYQLIGVSLGFEYRFLDNTTWTVDGQFYDLTDNEGWVYGDESGSMFMIRSGIKIDF